MKRLFSLFLALTVLTTVLTLAACGRKAVNLSGMKSLADLSDSGAVIGAQSGTFHLIALNEQIPGVTKKTTTILRPSSSR